MFELGVRTSIHNGKMRKLRKDMGFTQGQLADILGVRIDVVGKLETFQQYPSAEKLVDIADFLGSTVEELFPHWLQEQKIKRSSYETTVLVDRLTLDAPEVNLLEAPDDMAELVDKSILAKKARDFLGVLTDRERTIVSKVIGLDEQPMPYRKVGEQYGVSGERVAQIYHKAMRKMRQHQDAKEIKELL